MKSNTILNVNNLRKDEILHDISFSVTEGEMVAIMGPSGSGKSTLLYTISGMDEASSGEVWLRETEICSLKEDDKARLRLHKMGFVFQQMNMLSNLSLLDNVLLPAVREKGKDAYQDAKTLFEKMGIWDLAEREITKVSGGQLQRACICRSMINHPDILFADEPTGALNKNASGEVMQEFQKLNREGTTILLVTHDSQVAASCNRILYILDGELKDELIPTQTGEKERQKEVSDWLTSMGW